MAEDRSPLFDSDDSSPQTTKKAARKRTATGGLTIDRTFSTANQHPFDSVEWGARDAAIKSHTGEVIFEQKGVEFPKAWSVLATNVVASKYFYGDLDKGNGSPAEGGREYSLKQLVHRVTRTITDWGHEQGYFASQQDADTFYDELTWLCVHQHGAFNSPVWFNVGLHHQYGVRDSGGKTISGWDSAKGEVVAVDPYRRPQASACFIISVEDSVDDIWKLMGESARLFKFGSGVGADWSKLRSSKEKLSGGGIPSGPVSFMKVQDATGGTIKSGGKTRRAAIMQTLKVWHPDIEEFVRAKQEEEKKAWALIEEGYDGSFNGPAYGSVDFQNVNQSVRVTDAFMAAADAEQDFELKTVTSGETVETTDAKALLDLIAEGTHLCGDPGMQYEDQIQRWHTCKNHGAINSSNPCSEYMFLDDSACNLASLNLRKFQKPDGTFDVERYRAAARIYITAQEILVDNAGYPSAKIAANSHAYRPLGLGFANLGALLMSMGLPYDSDEGRAVAGAIMAIEHCEAYARSAEIAGNPKIGPFDGFADNRGAMLEVMRMHQAAVDEIGQTCPGYLKDAARESAARMVALGEKHGYRNAQATVLAPTGCLTADAMVLSSEGLLPITELGDPEGETWQATSLSVVQEEGAESATRFFINGRDRVYRIRTARGHEITGTWKHRLRVIDADGEYVWRRMEDIRAGDIAVLRLGGHTDVLADKPLVRLEDELAQDPRDERFALPEALNIDTAEMLGYYTGDGYVKEKGGLHLVVCDADPDLVEHFGSWIESIGARPTTEARQGCTMLHAHGRRLYRWMHRNGFAKPAGNAGEGAAGAEIPLAVLRSRTAVLGAYLRGLFEADGTVTTNTGGTPIIELTTVSPVLARQVHTALESMGIAAVLRKQEARSDQKGHRAKHRVRLASVSDCEAFAEAVGFISERKRAVLAEGLEAATGCATTGHTLRHQTLLDDLYQVAKGLSTTVRQDIATRRYQGKANLAWAARLIEQNPQLEASKLAQYLDMGTLQFVEVAEAEFAGKQETYDLSVPIRNTYVANGFVSHNTIGFMMDCDTTGIEPDIALVKYKLLAGKGDGMMKIVNQTVDLALENLGYSASEREAILAFVDENDTIEGAPGLKDEHLPVFDCAFKPFNGRRSIHHMGHILMMAACQPFISGAISKTVNLPEHATPEDIADAYMQGWKSGLKAVAIYRENSKRSQPLSTEKGGNTKGKSVAAEAESGDGASREPEVIVREVERVVEKIVTQPARRRLPDERPSITHKFSVAGHEGYLHIGLYPREMEGLGGMPGEIFITMAKQGSTISGLMDGFATSISLALQYGVPLEDLVQKFSHMRFEPAGFTNNRQIPIAKSLLDYVFRYLSLKFLGEVTGDAEAADPAQAVAAAQEQSGPAADESQADLFVGGTVEQALNIPTVGGASPGASSSGASGDGGGALKAAAGPERAVAFQNQDDSPACSNCGGITVRAGACYSCPNCGSSTGCG